MSRLYQNEKLILVLLCGVEIVFLLYAISNLSISYYEADIFYNQNGIVSFLANLSCEIFGKNDIALRLPSVLVHILNVILLYKVSKFYLKRRFDRMISVMIYMYLPGVLASAILVNISGIIVFFTLLAVYFLENDDKILLILTLSIMVFVDIGFYVLYFCMFLYAIYSKKFPLALLCAMFFCVTIFFYDVGFEGKPKGYFVDTFGIFAATFSPFVFLFFIYSLYRIWLKGSKNLLWFFGFGTFVLALLLSIRQRIEFDIVLPYCVVCVPLIVRVFFNSYRIRLPKFRKIHKLAAIISLLFLLLTSFLIVFNQSLYLVFFKNKPEKHFIYPYDIAKSLSKELKNMGIEAVNTLDDNRLALRLKFYDIGFDRNVILEEEKPNFYHKEIDIVKFKREVAKFYVRIYE